MNQHYKEYRNLIRNINNHPKEGVVFRDITPLLENLDAFKVCVDELCSQISTLEFNKIACIDARGFIVGVACALRMSKDFFLIRKKGKLPFDTFTFDYELEYGFDTLEVHTDSLVEEDKVIIIDDLLATGGTALAATNLIKQAKAKVLALGVFIDLPDLEGRNNVSNEGIEVFSLFPFSGE